MPVLFFRKCNLTILLLTSLTLSFNSLSQSDESHIGTHGMLMFGGSDGLFASHLPMFHIPHNIQVVFQFHFEDAKIDQVIKEKLQSASLNKEQVWTIVPTRFDLVRLDINHPQALSTLTVDVVEGHFERGGKNQFTDKKIVIDKLLIFNRLDTAMPTTEPAPRVVNYVVISTSEQSANQFLVKSLGLRPEADHLVRVHVQGELSMSEIVIRNSPTLSILDNQLAKALNKKMRNEQEMIRVQTLYLETKELQ